MIVESAGEVLALDGKENFCWKLSTMIKRMVVLSKAGSAGFYSCILNPLGYKLRAHLVTVLAPLQ